MKLIVLGSGTTVSSIRRSPPARYVEAAGGQFVARPKDFDVKGVEVVDDFDCTGVHMSSILTVHVPGLNSLAYRFQEDQKRMVFSGDCDYDPAIGNRTLRRLVT